MRSRTRRRSNIIDTARNSPTDAVTRAPPTVTARYREVLEERGYLDDPAQQRAASRLDALMGRLQTAASQTGWQDVFRRWLRRPPVARPRTGLYLWGGVGRGKTFLMDLFFQQLPAGCGSRCHFHRFMRDVHARLNALRNVKDPLQDVAAGIASQARVLCFDEFAVSDVADAMILGGLFEALFRRGVTLVATSNLPPRDLYRDGLQRQRFLPAIALLERHTEVLEVDAGIDYRLRQLERTRLYLGPAEADAEATLLSEFAAIAGEPGRADAALDVNGRTLHARRAAAEMAWFDFAALCAGPRSVNDYIELARLYHTIVLSGVPVLDRTRDDEARRFIALVDEFYDRGVKLIVSAAAEPASLYAGQRLAFEFRRTASRLVEMQGREYLARPHRP